MKNTPPAQLSWPIPHTINYWIWFFIFIIFIGINLAITLTYFAINETAQLAPTAFWAIAFIPAISLFLLLLSTINLWRGLNAVYSNVGNIQNKLAITQWEMASREMGWLEEATILLPMFKAKPPFSELLTMHDEALDHQDFIFKCLLPPLSETASRIMRQQRMCATLANCVASWHKNGTDFPVRFVWVGDQDAWPFFRDALRALSHPIKDNPSLYGDIEVIDWIIDRLHDETHAQSEVICVACIIPEAVDAPPADSLPMLAEIGFSIKFVRDRGDNIIQIHRPVEIDQVADMKRVYLVGSFDEAPQLGCFSYAASSPCIADAGWLHSSISSTALLHGDFKHQNPWLALFHAIAISAENISPSSWFSRSLTTSWSGLVNVHIDGK